MPHINHFHLDYISALRSEGHEVYVMANGDGADFNVKFEKKMLSFENLKCQRIIKRILKEEKFDVIILNTTLAAFNIRLAMPKKNRPCVINIVHGYMFPFKIKSIKDRIFFLCEKILSKKTDALIVMNTEDYTIAKKHKLSIGPTAFIYGMGAEVSKQKTDASEIRKELSIEDKYIISFVGELCTAKNQSMLIRALPEIQKSIPSACILLVGEGGAREELAALADEFGVSDSVHFVGHRPNPCDYIRASDLYVSASKKEGLPFNIIEALGCGVNVLASDIKGHRDIIEDGISGSLFNLFEMEDFVSKVKMIHDKEICFTKDNILARYEIFAKHNVFPKTYSVIKELMKG